MTSLKKKLFLIPFAGGNKTAFQAYEPLLKEKFELYPLELSGHGTRLSEPLHETLFEMRDDLLQQIEKYVDNDSIIYGHSLGGLLGYLLILHLEQSKQITPQQLIVSGRASPSLPPSNIRHNLPQKEFFNHLQNLGGMPSIFFEHVEFFELFEPILRADFKAIETFHFKINQQIHSQITVLFGKEDYFTLEEAKKWKKFTHCKSFQLHTFEGGHFFINTHTKAICDIMKAFA